MIARVSDGLIRTAEEITSPWLSGVLAHELEIASITRIGTGQMSLSYRVAFLDGAGRPGTTVVKLAASDPASRATGVGMGAYRREVDFYRELSDRIGGPLVRCHAA